MALSAASSASSITMPSSSIGPSQDDGYDDVEGQGQEGGGGEEGVGQDTIVTPAMLSSLLVKMREACLASLVQAGVLSVDGSGTINL
jgi:hypothetical protein